MRVAAEIAERIRCPMLPGLGVVPLSLPIVSFGDPDAAVVATLALNPSWLEFLALDGRWLVGDERRVASLVSLGIHDPNAMSDKQVEQTLAESYGYFRGPNWYRTWFGWLEALLGTTGGWSYLDGTACHLDLVQWATRPAQGEIPRASWERLVEGDREFLRWQLENSNVTVVFLNGRSVMDWIRRVGLVQDVDESDLFFPAANGRGRLRVYRAVSDGIIFVGWNRPLAGALAAAGRVALSEWVRQAVRGHGAADDTAGSDGAPLGGGPADGFIPVGTEVGGVEALHALLVGWLADSTAPTVADVATFGGSPAIVVRTSSTTFILNRDTKRVAVQTFLREAAAAGGVDRLAWHVTANARGRFNRVTYRSDDAPTPGWYAYLPESVDGPMDIA